MENAVITLTLSINEINVLLASLGKQPFEIVADLVQKIGGQARSQIDAQKTSEAPSE